jgi:hypothetical protein
MLMCDTKLPKSYKATHNAQAFSYMGKLVLSKKFTIQLTIITKTHTCLQAAQLASDKL